MNNQKIITKCRDNDKSNRQMVETRKIDNADTRIHDPSILNFLVP